MDFIFRLVDQILINTCDLLGFYRPLYSNINFTKLQGLVKLLVKCSISFENYKIFFKDLQAHTQK